jgi:phage N-6-adenine-methyltransferase
MGVVSEPKQKPGRSKQDYGTPWAFIRACEARWGRFDVDLAAVAGNAKAARFIGPEEESVSWATDRRCTPGSKLAWLNPPFADIAPWAKKCVGETGVSDLRIIMLTPASIGTEWFAEHVHGRAMVIGIRPRLTFEGAPDPYPKDLMLSLFGFGDSGFDVWKWA